ncbi:phosphoadenosine phosphosulfate reductase domain-containing protein [Persephonella sp.]
MSKKEYHILSLSGGKDSTALALWIKDNLPEIHEKIEYIFFDTEKELRETYEYLNKIESFLGKKIIRLKPLYSFDDLLNIYGNYLPSGQARWCTLEMKIKTFKKYISNKIKKEGKGKVYLYIGIRADENREGFKAGEDDYIIPVYPFKEHGIEYKDVKNILEKSGINFPKYYEWRSRSGCFFCFFQQKLEWLGLYGKHPDLYKRAAEYEKVDKETGTLFTWIENLPLTELIKPKQVKSVIDNYVNKYLKEINLFKKKGLDREKLYELEKKLMEISNRDYNFFKNRDNIYKTVLEIRNVENELNNMKEIQNSNKLIDILDKNNDNLDSCLFCHL